MEISNHAIVRYAERIGDTSPDAEVIRDRLAEMLRRSKPVVDECNTQRRHALRHPHSKRELRVFKDVVLVIEGNRLVTVYKKRHPQAVKAKRK